MSSRAGFTLLEMLLTLALSVVLMGLISGAINFYAREMDNAEQQFREAQLASALLQLIEDDLRMTLVTRPVSTEALSEVLAAAAAPLESLGLGATAEEGGETDDSLPPDDPDSLNGDPTLETDTSLETGVVLQSPGLIGNETQLQIDISRLPSLEQTAIDPDLAISSGVDLLDRPSDIKTISYFVQVAGSFGIQDEMQKLAATDENAAAGTTSTGGGLVRRQLDRAIGVQALSTGGSSRLDQTGEVIAPEVVAIGFEYYDGVNWLPQYSTDEMGYLPLAIRVRLQLEPMATSGGAATADQTSPTSIGLTEGRIFTHLIRLPMSFPEDGEALLEEQEAASTTEAPDVVAE
ncbi:prepilin-type N-terminal cleavage/methylation domain-containing protein [Rhodopirellula bahusiensis]|uniref:Prepilin-type cleavage/methylation domain-containing protein n=1 Tax=Rhodopirellula bahusiensis TaxID=2014065 RepID=A0A2G1W9A2_9BACT|nr:prepilin-type N-terminal cleavage/methylation domain-containing protein [Rhodopirellula bahusiensis]PHQ35625.1 prepilin-type cleavage/methylation domain-containing protein [Rhodopirellula bahusiensis]